MQNYQYFFTQNDYKFGKKIKDFFQKDADRIKLTNVFRVTTNNEFDRIRLSRLEEYLTHSINLSYSITNFSIYF